MATKTLLIRFARISTFLAFLSTGLIIVQGQGTNNSEAIITNTGSSEDPGYVITVSRSGDATYKWRSDNNDFQEIAAQTAISKSLRAKIPMPIVNKLFADLDTVSSVSNLPDEHPDHSDALETVTYITYRGQTSPDLSNSDNTTKSALYDDIAEVSLAFASKEDADDAVPTPPAQTTRRITFSDNDTTIELSVGQTIVVDLGSSCDWAVAGMDQGLLDQIETGADNKDGRRAYRVVSSGIMVLRMTGGPNCVVDKSSGATGPQDFQVAIFVRR